MLRRCGQCRSYHRQGERCPASKSRKAQAGIYQSTDWRTLSATVTAAGCSVPGCRTPRHYVVAHHLIGRRQGGPDVEWNLLPLCASHHSAYEAQHRAKRVTPLTRHVERHTAEAVSIARTLGLPIT